MAEITKMWIADKMREIMKHKPIDKIRVTEICKAADIERPTFYYHFKDMNGLLEWWLQEAVLAAAGEDFSLDNWDQRFLAMFQIAWRGRESLLSLYHSVDPRQFRRPIEQSAHELCARLLREAAERCSEENSLTERDAEFLTEVFRDVLLGVFFRWLQDGMTEEPTYLVNRSVLLLRNGVSKAIEKMSQTQAAGTDGTEESCSQKELCNQ
jgi:AcrR family transcriptional regulator